MSPYRNLHLGAPSFWRPSTHTYSLLFFFFNDTAPPEIYPLSLHDPLPISAPPHGLGHVLRAGTRGSLRIRFPVAAKIALASAGAVTAVPGSPIPPGGSRLRTRCTSIRGVSFIRSVR